MADATVTRGPYGYFYPYYDEKGKKHGLKIMDNVYENYYSKGYLTDAHLALLVEGKSVTFSVPSKSGGKAYEVSARVIDHTNKGGKACKIIEFTSNKESDKQILMKNAERLIASYWTGVRFDYTKPLKLIETLDLTEIWKTFAQNQVFSGIRYCTMSVYKSRAARNNSDNFMLYGRVDNDTCVLIDEADYERAKAKDTQEHNDIMAENARLDEEVAKVRKDLTTWIDSIIAKVWPNGASCSVPQIIDNLAAFITTTDVPSLEDRVRGYISAAKIVNVSSHFKYAKTDVFSITRKNYTDTTVVEKIKTSLMQNLRVCYEVLRIRQFRQDMLNELNQVGIDTLTESIDIDTALSLGYFPQVQRILNKHKSEAPKYIIMQMYKEVIDLDELKDKLLNMLKICHDFFDMPEKDRKSIAKFIAKNNLQDYYEQISVFDDVLEVLIDGSRDPKLTKPLLESIAGTPRAKVLKDKTFYFEKRGRLRKSVVVFKPVELLEELRSYIKEFNGSSGVAILTNIELDSDESFIFQFYTFAEGEGDEKGFDGRRMMNLTRIYNRNHPDKKIGFYFDNESEEDDDNN